MTHRHRRRIGASILALTAAALLPTAALAGPPPVPLPPNVFVGTTGPDELAGTPRADVMFGLAGPDTIWGGFGPDRIFAGPGDDKVRGGPGPDTIRGGLGADKVHAGAGNDLVMTAGDEAIDTILCGDGRADLAIVDPDDVVGSDCEYIWARDPES